MLKCNGLLVYLWNYSLIKRFVRQTDAEAVMSVMSVITLESKQLLYSDANIGTSIYSFSVCVH